MMSELEKCKNDIVYFVEHYVVDTKGNHIKLHNYQKEYLRYLQEKQLTSKDISNINHNLIYIHSRNIYKDKANAYIRAYNQFVRNTE